MNSKRLKQALGLIALLLILITMAGIYKFNILQDDIYIEGSAITSEDKALFIGSWVEPIPGNESEVQGFRLYEDGSASSINMHTLLYQKWALKDGQLILTAKSIGNHTSSVDDETYTIELIGKNSLKLNNGFASFTYKKQ
ncbi:lipocalin family protein [Ancylomarina sp.]|uniref:lipocalin family protein n=1 Tax=Ancylomarina sp. TaxID=1970196 RepID=UPI003564D15F